MNSDLFDFDKKFQELELQLKNIESLEVREFKVKELKELKEVKEFEEVKELKEVKESFYFDVDLDLSLEYMYKFTNPDIALFLLDISDNQTKFVIQDIYGSTKKTLEELLYIINYLKKYWKQLRKNLKKLENIEPKKHDKTGIIKTWKKLGDFSTQKQKILNQAESGVDPSLLGYFYSMEYYIFSAFHHVINANRKLNRSFNIWRQAFKESFETACVNFQQEGCQQACFWKDDKCVEKPFLMVLDDIVKVYCGSTQSTEKDQEIRHYIYEVLKIIFSKWFYVFNVQPSGNEECDVIFFMYDTIKETIQKELGKDIRWSQARGLVNIPEKVWHDLWGGSKPKLINAIHYLDSMDKTYDQKSLSFILSLIQLSSKIQMMIIR